MIQRIVMSVIAVAAMAAAAGVVVVSAAFALFALVRDAIGPSGAAAVVCLAAAILIAIIGLVAFRKAKPAHRPAHKSSGPQSLAERLGDAARQRPAVAAAAAVGAGLLAWKNPVMMAAVLRLLDPRPDRERV